MTAPSPRHGNLTRPARVALATGVAFVAGALAVPGAYAAPAEGPAAVAAQPRDDFNGDGYADLAVAAPGENSGAGSVWYFRSTPAAVTGSAGTFGAGTLGTVATGAKLGTAFAD
ncbi:FG-GAP repeat protein [Streptomyces sp. NPDC051740]|uniref:FG-GAP repeat protein n=1 Tax=Streptomyces sp. NPDC051740 TaxID=3365673 RepID=UPI0037AC2F56